MDPHQELGRQAATAGDLRLMVIIRPSTEAVQAMGTLTTPLQGGYYVPPLPLLLGVQVTWQGASIDASHGVQISNGVTYVHN